jgi:iron complex outermembrane receptor protein
MNIKTSITYAISCIILAGLSATLAPAAALAQEASAQDAIDEIIVSARKRDERIQDVPIAITAIDNELMEREQLNSIKEVANFVPGLIINSDAVNRAFVSIRGIGTTLIDSVQPGVGIFIDGIYQPNTSYLNNPVLDVERIEVLKGPQGTLFGNNTLGGAINVVTRKPTDELAGRFVAVYADGDDYQTVTGAISGPIVEGTLRGRLAASYHGQDGFSTNLLAGGDARPLDHRSVNGSLAWDANAKAEISLNAYFDSVEGGITAYSNPAGPTDYLQDVTLNLNSSSKIDYTGVNLKSVFDIESWGTELTAVLAYDDKDATAVGDGDFGPVDFARVRDGQNTLKTTTGELRFDTNWSDNVSTLIGLFAFESKTTNSFLQDLPLFGLEGIPSATHGKLTGQAVFGTIFWQVADEMELAIGMRYDDQKITSTNDISGFSSDYSTSEFQPRVSLSKRWSEEFMTYASISRGFRGGGTNGPGAPNPIYEGDSVWSYEVGSKISSSERQLVLNLAAYYNDYQDFIGQNSLAAPVGGGALIAINLNSGDVESYGAEAELSWQATDNFRLHGGLSLNHTRVTDGSQYENLTGIALATDRILFVPDYTYFANGSYSVPVGQNELRFDATLVGKGSRYGSTLSPTFQPKLESYSVVNANITWDLDNWYVALWATNLTDEIYYESYLDESLLSTVGFTGPLVNNLGITSDGRRVGLRVGVNF